jgi:hypothetical protein
MTNTESFDILLGKIEVFIRKYYKNQLLKGLILGLGITTLFFLLSSLTEYFGEYNSSIRTFLFYLNALLILGVFLKFIIVPLAGLFKLGKRISHENAAEIIGNHFTEVRDKLINTLQLKQKLETDSENTALLLAGIDQKIAEIKPVPFTSAIDLKANLKHLRYAGIPLIVILFLLIAAPEVITESSKRIIAYNQAFDPVAPFQFSVISKDLKVAALEDFMLDVQVSGSELPKEVYIEVEGTRFLCTPEGKRNFNYQFKNVKQNIPFRLYADGFYSKPYELISLPNPVLVGFDVYLDYPAYTGMADEMIKNSGNINIPQGTTVKWVFKTDDTRELAINFDHGIEKLTLSGDGSGEYSRQFLNGEQYSIKTSNEFLQGKNQMQYAVSVKADEYPSISVEEEKDSLLGNQFLFKGKVEDDYGISSLKFMLKKPNEAKAIGTAIPFNQSYASSFFFWEADFSMYELKPGDEIEYWFEVWDNDGVNGSKSSRTQKRVYRNPSEDELKQMRDAQTNSIKTDLTETIKDAKKLQKELDELNRKLLEKKEMNWQDKNKAKELLDKQKQLEAEIKNLQQEIKQNNDIFSKEKDDQMLEKQRQIEELLDQVLSDEMKEKLKQLEEMMKNLDKNQLREEMQKLKQDNKDVEKELDRTLELFKQMELEQKMKDAIDKLDDLQKKQDELADKSLKKDESQDNLKKQQDSLNKAFDALQKDLDDIEKKNQDLENPMEMEKTDQKEQEIEQEMKNSSDQLQKKNGGKASKSQKSASQKMQQMKEQMEQQMQENESESLEEDVSKIREILENLVQLSFDQERLMKQLGKTSPTNPLYVKITAEQKRLKDVAYAIEDSLFALSKRVEEIQSIVNREIGKVNNELDRTIEFLAERQTAQANGRQQMAMTSINNLALLLSEVSDQMQQQLAQQQQQQKQGNGSCKKPGNNKKPGSGKPSVGAMRQMQQQLNEQLEKMKSEMGKPGKGKDGKSGSEQLAKMAAQQEMLRNQLQKIMNEMLRDGDGGNTGNLKSIMNKMEQTETDIVNKNISQETLKRQQEIMTRLLEAERAEQERDQDDKRESNENNMDFKRNQKEFEQYMKQINSETESLKTISPQMKPYYKYLVKEYFENQN